MANIFLNLPVPVTDGVGAAVDVSAMGRTKTITLAGTFVAAITIEASLDGGASFFPVPGTGFNAPGDRTVDIACDRMRVRVANANGVVAANCDVGSNDDGTALAPLPAPPGDGVAASVNVSALGTFNTVTVTGAFSGSVVVEISQDDVDFVPVMSFGAPGLQSRRFVAQFMRVRRSNTGTAPGTPVVNVMAVNDPVTSSGPGGSATAVLGWGNTSIAAAADTRFISPGFTNQTAPTTSAAAFRAPRAGTLRNFRARHNSAVGNGNAVVYDVVINSVPSGLGLSLVSGAIGDASDLVTTIAVAAGDLVEVTATKALSIGSGGVDAVFVAEFA